MFCKKCLIWVQLVALNLNLLPMDFSFMSVNHGSSIKVGMWAAQKKSDVEGISEEVENIKILVMKVQTTTKLKNNISVVSPNFVFFFDYLFTRRRQCWLAETLECLLEFSL